MDKKRKRPTFTMAYVLRATMGHMRRCVQVSIDKTQARWPEFKDDPVKSNELMVTLMKLNRLKSVLDEFQKTNSQDFKDTPTDD